MKTTIKGIAIGIATIWLAGLSLYYAKKFGPTAGLAGKATEGYGV